MDKMIYKSGGVILQDRKFLVTRSVGKDIFIAPGGKLEPGETPEVALARELNEELGIYIDLNSLEPLGSFEAIAAGHEDTIVRMVVYIVHHFTGEPQPSAEVQELRWIDTTTDIALGSIFEHDVMPLLKTRGLID